MEHLLDQIRQLVTVERVGTVNFALIRIVTIVFASLIAVKIEHRFVSMLRSRIVDMMKRHRPGGSVHQSQKESGNHWRDRPQDIGLRDLGHCACDDHAGM